MFLSSGLILACASYTPAPVRPDSHLEAYNGRRLDDAGLLAWFDSLGQPRPGPGWTPRQLALAAEWFRADRSLRQAEVHQAEASLITAGARPQPGVSTDLEYAFTDPQADSRWGLALAGLFTLELGGKRGARIARARASVLAAAAAAVESEWLQAVEVYATALDWDGARQAVTTARAERLAQDTIAGLAEARYQQGVLTRLDLARVEADRRASIALEQTAERDERVARAALATRLGVPGAATEAIELAAATWPGCDSAATRENLQRAALGARWSIRRVAAEYQVAEGSLRIAVANASPDLTLGPGMFYDQGTGKFTLAAALPSLPLNRNKGPIAEAEAERATAGARLVREQELVLGEVDGALAGCEAARQSVAAAESLSRQTETRVSLADSAYARGETGRLEVAAARLDARRARRLAVEAGLGLRRAGLALDRAVGAWGIQRDGAWPTRRAEPSGSGQ